MELSHWAVKSFPSLKGSEHCFQFGSHGLPLKTKSVTVAPQITARVTGEPTMGSIEGQNKDTSVWWCATQLSSQVALGQWYQSRLSMQNMWWSRRYKKLEMDKEENTLKGRPEFSVHDQASKPRWDLQRRYSFSWLWRPFSPVRRRFSGE